MEKVDYDARLHAVYAAGRQMSPDPLQTWMEAFARHLPETRPLTWLDLGSGTGRMTPALAEAFGGPVYGIEPSDKMRAQANPHPDVTYADTGFTFVSKVEVTWLRSASLTEDLERLKLRAVSLFERAGEEVIEAGFARIEDALPSLDPGPQFETNQLLVFRRS
jgi:cyclopropane fatty-acyl-phospholipid synthase-like methyltransferase